MTNFLGLLLTLLHIVSLTEECSVSALRGEILGCMVDGKEYQKLVTDNTTFRKNTDCFVEHSSDVRHYRCDGEQWIVTEGITTPTHSRVKRSWGRFWRGVRNVVGGLFKGVSCVVTLLSCLWAGRDGPVDNTPPSIKCLSPQPAVAEPYQNYAKVVYDIPTAHDETDGNLRPVRVRGRPSGRHFPEGDDIVTFEVKDRAGNRASCNIYIHVKVVRCPDPKQIQNGYFQCHPVTEFLYGGGCHFGCYEGFDLVGKSEISCLATGQWSDPKPECRPWKCPPIGSIPGAAPPACTNSFFFRSICTYNCGTGFDMPAGVCKTRVCDKTKSWTECGEPRCVDVEPPRFETCPSLIIRGTDTGANSTDVTWPEPKVEDNSNTVHIFVRNGVKPGTRFTVGTHDIRYFAQDDAGNPAVNDCSFKVIVREIRCPKLYPTPYVHFDCPDGYRSGARCSVSCDPGKSLIGSDDVGCQRNSEGLFADWNWKDGEQATCKDTKKCVQLTPPKLGAIACDNWEGGQYCQIQCKNGTEMSSVSLNRLYVCRQDGSWSVNPPSIQTCREKRSPHLVLEASASYYTGDCTDKKTQEQIANNFISAIEDDLISPEACPPDSIECNSNNVQIFCGPSTRRKRSVTDNGKELMILELKFRLPVPLSNKANETDEDQFLQLIENAKAVLKHKESDIFTNFTVNVKDFVSHGIQIVCPIGTVRSEQSLSCVDCPEGTFYTDKHCDGVCKVCSKGYYQEKTAQLSCRRCPAHKTTRGVGAESIFDCEDACEPGTYSADGLPPCTPCEQGSYQVSHGRSFCKSCPSSKTTLTFGAQSVSECDEFDIHMVEAENSSILLLLQDSVVLDDFTLSMWIQQKHRLNDSSDDGNLIIRLHDKTKKPVWTWNIFSGINRQNDSDTMLAVEMPDSRWHHIVLQSRSCNITGTIDGALLPDSLSFGRCQPLEFTLISVLSDQHSDTSISQLNIWNNSHKVINSHRCFDGETGNAVSWKQFEEARLSGAYVNIPSQCDDFSNCISSPCLHGKCTDALHGYSCACNEGFSGKQCEINIDDCSNNICMNNAKCVDGVANFTCSCENNYTGRYCETAMVDGQWSEWGNWSECDTTCGPGLQKRRRLCNSPTPDNGGKYCVGEMFDYIDCNNTDCPVCPEIMAPGNGSLDCLNDTESINCTVTCDDGYEFDTEPLPEYYCGPETVHVWNFQTDENPERKLPRCVAIQMPEKLQVVYSAHYRDLYCATNILEEHAQEQIDKAVKAVVTNLPCVRKNTCTLADVQVIDCDKDTRRKPMKTAGFSLEITSHPNEENKNETLTDLQNAFLDIQRAADEGHMTVEVLDDDYYLDLNTTDVSGKVKCPAGATRVNFYCVLCGAGSYFYINYCKPCPIGTYQNQEGQSSCLACPSRTSTMGIRSTSKDDCTVKMHSDLETGIKLTGIIVGCVCGLAAVVVGIFAYRRYRARKEKLISPSDILNESSSASSQKNARGDLGPSSKHFKPKIVGASNGASGESVDMLGRTVTRSGDSRSKSNFEMQRMTMFTSDDGRVFRSKPWI